MYESRVRGNCDVYVTCVGVSELVYIWNCLMCSMSCVHFVSRIRPRVARGVLLCKDKVEVVMCLGCENVVCLMSRTDV